MQSKYKSPVFRALLTASCLLALITGGLGDGSVRLIAWASAVVIAVLLIRPARFLSWLPLLVIVLGVAMSATGPGTATLWLWLAPLCLLGFSGRLGLALNVIVYAFAVAGIIWIFPLPTALIASLALAVIWLLSLHRQTLLESAPTTQEVRWLLPPARLDTDIQHERKRSEREVLYGEVTVFGCAHSTASDMEQLCRLLYENLALYERAYRLNDYGIAVLLIAIDAQAADERRRQLQHAIAPHRLVSTTSLDAIGDRFSSYRTSLSIGTSEVHSWQ